KIAEFGGVSLDWLITGREQTRANGEIAATIEPGRADIREQLARVERGRESSRNVFVKQIVAWMDEEFSEEDERALFFYEDLKDRYPSFAKFMEKKRPGADYQVAEPPNKYNSNG
ncbi:MAG: hypothetical protein P1P81_08190, partial [Desulfobulbales bacterium]|nr:hypothetical protein [Desulfobulbales bacterium]